MGWREVASERYPDRTFTDATDLYMRVSENAVAISIRRFVIDSWQRLTDSVDIGSAIEAHFRDGLDAAAYSVGYRALLLDAKSNSVEELSKLTEFIDTIAERRGIKGE